MRESTTSKGPEKVGRLNVFPCAIERVLMRRTVVLLTVMLAMLVLASGVAMAAVFKGTPGNDEIYGSTQNDTIYGYGGHDELYGSPPDRVGSGVDTIYGGLGKDIMRGLLGPDTITAGSGGDWLSDGPIKDGMKDKLSGGPGDDVLISNNYPRATDEISCGDGIDTVYADSADAFLDRSNCEKITIYNPTSATDEDATYPYPGSSSDSCEDPEPGVPCTPDSRPRHR